MRCRLAGFWIMRMPRSISRVRPTVASCPHSGSAVYFATTSGSLQIQSFGVRASREFPVIRAEHQICQQLAAPGLAEAQLFQPAPGQGPPQAPGQAASPCRR